MRTVQTSEKEIMEVIKKTKELSRIGKTDLLILMISGMVALLLTSCAASLTDYGYRGGPVDKFNDYHDGVNSYNELPHSTTEKDWKVSIGAGPIILHESRPDTSTYCRRYDFDVKNCKKAGCNFSIQTHARYKYSYK